MVHFTSSSSTPRHTDWICIQSSKKHTKTKKMNTELLHNLLLTLILATNVLLLFKEGSPSLVKPSQAQAEGSGIRKLQQGQEEYQYDGDVAFHHRTSGSRNRNRVRDAFYIFGELAWDTRAASELFDALDRNKDGQLDFCEFREMLFQQTKIVSVDSQSIQPSIGRTWFSSRFCDF